MPSSTSLDPSLDTDLLDGETYDSSSSPTAQEEETDESTPSADGPSASDLAYQRTIQAFLDNKHGRRAEVRKFERGGIGSPINP